MSNFVPDDSLKELTKRIATLESTLRKATHIIRSLTQASDGSWDNTNAAWFPRHSWDEIFRAAWGIPSPRTNLPVRSYDIHNENI